MASPGWDGETTAPSPRRSWAHAGGLRSIGRAWTYARQPPTFSCRAFGRETGLSLNVCSCVAVRGTVTPARPSACGRAHHAQPGASGGNGRPAREGGAVAAMEFMIRRHAGRRRGCGIAYPRAAVESASRPLRSSASIRSLLPELQDPSAVWSAARRYPLAPIERGSVHNDARSHPLKLSSHGSRQADRPDLAASRRRRRRSWSAHSSRPSPTVSSQA